MSAAETGVVELLESAGTRREEDREVAGDGRTILTLDRESGGLSITSTSAAFELLVDDKLCSINQLELREQQIGRANRIIDNKLDELLPFWRIGDDSEVIYRTSERRSFRNGRRLPQSGSRARPPDA